MGDRSDPSSSTLHRCGWNLAWRRGLLRAKFHAHRCNDNSIGPPKMICFLRFDKNVEYKRSARAYPLRDFDKIGKCCTTFQGTLAVKISLDLLKGLWSYGGFKLTGSGYPKVSAPPTGETMHQTPKSFRGTITCTRSSITVPSLVGLGFYPSPGRPKTLSFLCLFICPWRFWPSEFVRPI